MSTNRHNVPRALWMTLLAVAGLALITRLFVDHHGHFGIDDTYAFYSWFAFGAAVAGIAVARIVAAVLGREDTSA